MNKVAILVFALAISYAYGACSPNLGTWFGVTIPAGNLPAAGNELAATLDSCANQQGQLSCCTAALITGIKGTAATLQTALETAAGNRDKAILAARKAVAAQKDNYAKWLAAASAASSVITKWKSSPPSGVTAAQVTAVETSITTIKTLWDAFFKDYATIRTGFTTYQKDRATCFTTMIKEATAAKCLSCIDDGAFTANGVSGVTASAAVVAYNTALDTRMAAACRPYFIDSETQTNVFTVEQYAAKMADMTTALTKIAAETSAGVAEFTTAATPATRTGAASSIDEAVCTVTTCPWLTSTVFVNGKLSNDDLVRGGAAVTRRRMLTERSLQTTYNPDAAQSKVTATFPENPGSVTNVNDLSALRVGVFSCIVAFFVALLI